ncbi:putative porin [Cloacibacterium sp.]|uniref:putative porin n=1 Tax=Cloacibacterium sp. TaxID=1913682 RepID=UPI0039E69362
MKYIFLVIFFCATVLEAQIIKKPQLQNKNAERDTLVIDKGGKDSVKIFKPTINDYLIQTQFSEKKIFDTVFTVDKSYQFSQFNNRDNFGKIQFANIGSGFQDLVFSVNKEQNLSLLPTNKSHFILGIDDVKYYDVKTPTTSFVYHNAMKQGAALNSTYTQNIGKNFNFAVEYMGLRSQGIYRRSLAASNNFVFSSHFNSKNGRYQFFTHYIHQNVNNEENGGLEDVSLFLGDDSRFNNRQNLSVNLTASDSRFSLRRYYFSQEFQFVNSEKYPFKLRHTLYHQANKYRFIESSTESYYTSSYVDDFDTYAYKFSKNLSNTVSLVFDKKTFKLDAGFRHQLINLGTDRELPTAVGVTIPTDNKENRLGAVGNLEIRLWDKVDLKSFLEYSNGKSFGNYIRSENLLKLEPIKGYILNAHVNFQSAIPSFNYLINPSFYQDFNYNFSNAQNQSITEIGGKINLKWFDSSVFANYFRIDNLAYFDTDFLPKQSAETMNISQIGGEATVKYRKFNLNTKLLFQSALSQKELFPMPSFVGRVNIFYQTKAFKNAAEIQSGIKVYYFSKFNSRDYFPVLNEFVLSNSGTSIGGQPIADAYFNMKVKRMMFFVEAQHFNTTFMKNKSFTAPNYPIYDFRLNLGIVWYIFH